MRDLFQLKHPPTTFHTWIHRIVSAPVTSSTINPLRGPVGTQLKVTIFKSSPCLRHSLSMILTLSLKQLDLVTRQGGTKKLKIPYHLKGEHVLSQIVSHFVHGVNHRILIHCVNPKATVHKTFPVHYSCKMVNFTFRLCRMES